MVKEGGGERERERYATSNLNLAVHERLHQFCAVENTYSTTKCRCFTKV